MRIDLESLKKAFREALNIFLRTFNFTVRMILVSFAAAFVMRAYFIVKSGVCAGDAAQSITMIMRMVILKWSDIDTSNGMIILAFMMILWAVRIMLFEGSFKRIFEVDRSVVVLSAESDPSSSVSKTEEHAASGKRNTNVFERGVLIYLLTMIVAGLVIVKALDYECKRIFKKNKSAVEMVAMRCANALLERGEGGADTEALDEILKGEQTRELVESAKKGVWGVHTANVIVEKVSVREGTETIFPIEESYSVAMLGRLETKNENNAVRKEFIMRLVIKPSGAGSKYYVDKAFLSWRG